MEFGLKCSHDEFLDRLGHRLYQTSGSAGGREGKRKGEEWGRRKGMKVGN